MRVTRFFPLVCLGIILSLAGFFNGCASKSDLPPPPAAVAKPGTLSLDTTSAPRTITVLGFGAFPPETPPAQAKLLAKRAAQLDANRKLLDILTAPPYEYSEETAVNMAQMLVREFEYQAVAGEGINCKIEIVLTP